MDDLHVRDLKLPGGHDDAEALARQIQEAWDEGKGSSSPCLSP